MQSNRWVSVWTTEQIEAINSSFDETYHNVKMDLIVCRKNLSDLKDAFDTLGIPFYLLFGTLLGAYRDQDFIRGDHDTDIGVTSDQVDALIRAFREGWLLAFNEWKVIRVWNTLLSFARGGEYVDLYVFEDSPDPAKLWSCEHYYLEKKLLNPPGRINFWGREYQTVNNIELYLSDRYGNWVTPANVNATK